MHHSAPQTPMLKYSMLEIWYTTTMYIYTYFLNCWVSGTWTPAKTIPTSWVAPPQLNNRSLSKRRRCSLAWLFLAESFSSVFLVGGFNPSEKYARQIGSSPQVRVKQKNIWNHHQVFLGNETWHQTTQTMHFFFPGKSLKISSNILASSLFPPNIQIWEMVGFPPALNGEIFRLKETW